MRYVSKTTEIEAIQYTGYNKSDIEYWIKNITDKPCSLKEWKGDGINFTSLLILDQDKKLTARAYDYVVRSEDNSFYPMCHELFENLFKENV